MHYFLMLELLPGRQIIPVVIPSFLSIELSDGTGRKTENPALAGYSAELGLRLGFDIEYSPAASWSKCAFVQDFLLILSQAALLLAFQHLWKDSKIVPGSELPETAKDSRLEFSQAIAVDDDAIWLWMFSAFAIRWPL